MRTSLKVNRAQKADEFLRFTVNCIGFVPAGLSQMLQNLFNVFAMPDSSENEYAMKATMRLISFMGDSIKPIAGVCLERLSGMVMETCKNPRNPTFSHYLFESVAALVKAGALKENDDDESDSDSDPADGMDDEAMFGIDKLLGRAFKSQREDINRKKNLVRATRDFKFRVQIGRAHV